MSVTPSQRDDNAELMQVRHSETLCTHRSANIYSH
jgi:hypothetical protein